MSPLRAPRLGTATFIPALLTLGMAVPSTAQFPQWSAFPLPYVEARVLPRGQLQFAFLPSYAHYDMRFDSSGVTEPLGRYLTTDSAGSNFLAGLVGPEASVATIIGNASYRMTLGKVTLPLDADVRRFPFDFSVGLTDRLTLGVRLPQVRTRVQGVLTFDSSTANVGWNQAAVVANNPQGLTQILTLLSQLQTAAATLETSIMQGGYSCPGSAQCDQAMQLLARTQALLATLNTLTGPPGSGVPLPPVAPLASSPAGQQLRDSITAVALQLQGLGLGGVTATLPLPTTGLTTADLTTVLGSDEFGYGLAPPATVRWSSLGDAEAFLRFGMLRGPRLRAVLTTTIRLPTGKREQPEHVFDLGTGDHQLDLEGGLELAWEPGRLGISGMALYTRQFADQISIRWASPQRPITLAAYEAVTERKLGDVFRAAIYPSLALSEGFRVYGSAYYWHKARDSYTEADPGANPLLGEPERQALASGSAGQSLSLGGGISYRATRPQRDTTGTLTTLPVEAGLSYQAAFSGSGGLVPKSTMLNLYLRFYFRLFGKRE